MGNKLALPIRRKHLTAIHIVAGLEQGKLTRFQKEG